MRTSMAVVLALLLGGCGDSYQPAKREHPPIGHPPIDSHVTAPGPADFDHPPIDSHVTAPEPADFESGGTLEVGSIRLTAPESWVRQRPRSEIVSAEFRLPPVEEDERAGRLTVTLARGTIEGNIERWRRQFGGTPEKETEKEREVAGLKVTVVDFSGTFKDQVGPFAPEHEQSGYRMLAAIIPVEGQLHFVKGYGPEETMARHVEAFNDFLGSLERK
ncbi:MAG: hypothetical protein R6U98_00280 [Pirellulaceae bacterium]